MILVINTSSSDLEFALGEHYRRVAVEKQSLALADECGKFMAECGAKWSDLSAIAVVVGPGSFTGIRLGIAYAKGLAMGLNIPLVPVNAFELYLRAAPDAFVAIDSGRGDFFVASALHAPGTMTIDDVETEQMKCPRTVGHKPFDLKLATEIATEKLSAGNIEPAVPLYLRPSYVETNKEKVTTNV